MIGAVKDVSSFSLRRGVTIENGPAYGVVGKLPNETPTTSLLIPTNLRVFPSEETYSTLLNVAVLTPTCWYLTRASVLIPKNDLPAQVAIPLAAIKRLSTILKPGAVFC